MPQIIAYASLHAPSQRSSTSLKIIAPIASLYVSCSSQALFVLSSFLLASLFASLFLAFSFQSLSCSSLCSSFCCISAGPFSFLQHFSPTSCFWASCNFLLLLLSSLSFPCFSSLSLLSCPFLIPCAVSQNPAVPQPCGAHHKLAKLLEGDRCADSFLPNSSASSCFLASSPSSVPRALTTDGVTPHGSSRPVEKRRSDTVGAAGPSLPWCARGGCALLCSSDSFPSFGCCSTSIPPCCATPRKPR
mmetsp:Transcript_16085/g.37172  ORF Transcript_16085/g.37172 Transcript_16085/m.37172 type:complete len:246 (+) Transcript_16085:2191-2928(+)